jgi:polysaccharide export outer membrane protein
MRKWVYLLSTISLALCSTFVRAQGPAPRNSSDDGHKILLARDMNPQPVKALSPDPHYTIGADDVLTIDVWKEPEISRTVPVRTDGKISLPLLNDVQAAGLTPEQLGLEITERLSKDLVHPRVTVIVAEMNSQRIYILGQVLRGGTYPLQPHMTAVQALSSVGFTPFANLRKIFVMRTKDGQKQILPIDLKEVISGHKPGQDVQLKPDDTIVVP